MFNPLLKFETVSLGQNLLRLSRHFALFLASSARPGERSKPVTLKPLFFIQSRSLPLPLPTSRTVVPGPGVKPGVAGMMTGRWRMFYRDMLCNVYGNSPAFYFFHRPFALLIRDPENAEFICFIVFR